MRAEVLADLTINSVPKSAGEIVDVDENTFRNLERQGLLKPAPSSPVCDVEHHAAAAPADAAPAETEKPAKPARKTAGGFRVHGAKAKRR